MDFQISNARPRGKGTSVAGPLVHPLTFQTGHVLIISHSVIRISSEEWHQKRPNWFLFAGADFMF